MLMVVKEQWITINMSDLCMTATDKQICFKEDTVTMFSSVCEVLLILPNYS
jgi:hypothetical protein